MLVKTLLYLCKAGIYSVLYQMMCIFPLRDNRIFFQSYEEAAGFTDNPKYLCKCLYEKYGNQFEYLFAVNKNVNNMDADYVKPVPMRSVRKIYDLATSKTVVFNVRTPVWLKRRKGQLVINTWHGGGAFKRTGIHKNTVIGAWAENRIRNYINLFVSSSQIFTQSNIVEGMQYQGEILPCGMPRNDLFFSPEAVDCFSATIRRQYGLGDTLCVLFAPTFRGKGDDKINILPPLTEVADILRQKTGRDVAILVRKHQRDTNHYDIPGVTVDVGSYPDPQELLCCADILITDYSSTMWDFALLGRPCFLFIPDLDEYDRNRGFFTPVEDWPGILCHNEAELLQEMKMLDFERSRRIAETYLVHAGSYENGHAAETLADCVFQHIFGQLHESKQKTE